MTTARPVRKPPPLRSARPARSGPRVGGRWLAALLGVLTLACAHPKPSASDGRGEGEATAADPATRAALARLRERPTWLFPAAACPADVVGSQELAVWYPLESCDGDLTGCLERCAQGDAALCYVAALRVQALGADPEAHEALFLHACRGGVTSGCTNRAAGMILGAKRTAESAACAARTFALTCDQRDPWGCTMRALALAEPFGVAQDFQAALRALEGSCLRGEDDPACSAAHDLEAKIRRALESSAAPAP